MNWLKKIKTRWREKEFKRYFFGLMAVFIATPFVDIFIGLSFIGGTGALVSLILLILIGLEIYKERKELNAGAFISFLVFITVLVLFGKFGSDIIEVIVFSDLLQIIIRMVILIAFWITFFLFWLQKTKLSTKIFAYISALCLYYFLFPFIFVLLVYFSLL